MHSKPGDSTEQSRGISINTLQQSQTHTNPHKSNIAHTCVHTHTHMHSHRTHTNSHQPPPPPPPPPQPPPPPPPPTPTTPPPPPHSPNNSPPTHTHTSTHSRPGDSIEAFLERSLLRALWAPLAGVGAEGDFRGVFPIRPLAGDNMSPRVFFFFWRIVINVTIVEQRCVCAWERGACVREREVRVCVRERVCACKSVKCVGAPWLCERVCICMYLGMCVWMYVCVCMNVCTFMCVRVYLRVCVCM